MAASIKKVIFVLGPTASGKSAWALEQVGRTGGSIINIDSVQFYKGLEIGSAAPTPQEKKTAPHYLYSYVVAPYEMTAGKYIDQFYKLIEDPQIKFPLYIVGGTGFYVQALEKGLYDIEPIPLSVRQNLEKELGELGPDQLFNELKEKDPNTFIHRNDHYRLVRALEIIRTTGKIPSKMKSDLNFKKHIFPFPILKVGFTFEKDFFLKCVEQRTNKMIKQGIIEETQLLLNQNFASWAPLSSVGFKEVVEFLRENKTKDWLKENINQATMKLIKKQKTWFKRDQAILWSEQSRHLDLFLSGD